MWWRSGIAYGIGYRLHPRWLWRMHHLAHPCDNGDHYTAKIIGRQVHLPPNLASGTWPPLKSWVNDHLRHSSTPHLHSLSSSFCYTQQKKVELELRHLQTDLFKYIMGAHAVEVPFGGRRVAFEPLSA